MNDEGADPGAEGIAVPYRPRGRYTGYKAFGSGEGAVLVEPRVSHELRSAAEFAAQERRVTGGLLYGRGWSDEQGAYLVISGFLEAGPGENRGDRIAADGTDQFTLSVADLRLLREDAARMYSASYELGWWRTRPALGEFSPGDFDTQAELVGPDGVGLLVYGSGVHWGTAYLGPDGHPPDSAGTLVAAPAAPETAEPLPVDEPLPDAEEAPAPESHVMIDLGAGESLLDDEPPDVETVLADPGLADPGLADPGLAEPGPADPGPGEPVLANAETAETAVAAGPTLGVGEAAWGSAAGGGATAGTTVETAGPEGSGPEQAGLRRARRRPAGAPPGPGRQRVSAAAGRVTSRVRVPRARGYSRRPADTYPGPALPVDVQLVVIALAIATIAAAIIIGVLVHSVVVGVIIAVIGLLAVVSTVWMSRR